MRIPTSFYLSLFALAAPLWCLADTSGHGAHAAMGSGRLAWMVDGDTVNASIRAVDEGVLTLLLEDGEQKRVPVARLGEAERKRVAHWKMVNRAPEGFGEADRTLRLVTLQGQMRYSEEEVKVRPGQKVQLILHNVDDMHHNLLLCTPDSEDGMEVAQAAWKLGGDGFERQWIPDHPKVLFASRMADPHSTIHGYFTAPEETGIYPYVCTLPGHAAFMKGKLVVEDTPTDLSELTFTLYRGAFDQLPDFERLTPEATDHVPSGLIDLSVTDRKENFALVFEGILNVPEDGEYRFLLASDDGSQLWLDEEKVIDNDGVHGVERKRARKLLTKGPHAIRVSYFEKSGGEELMVRWSGPGFEKGKALSAEPKRRGDQQMRGIPLASQNGEARLYRNFIDGAGNRAIGVGYPGGINVSFDADQMRLAQVWLGGFMDAARHWRGRGQGHQPPLGYGVLPCPEGAPLAALATPEASWPTPEGRSPGFQFKGYTLVGKQRLPVFRYQMGTVAIEDAIAPEGALLGSDIALNRTLTLRAEADPPEPLYFRAALAEKIDPVDGEFLVDASVVITLEGGEDPLLRKQGDRWELLQPILFHEGTATVKQRFAYLLGQTD